MPPAVPLESGRDSGSDWLPISNIQMEDLICPICRSTLMEPVLLPCRHAYCLSCLNRAVEYCSLTCPCCKKRFSTWFRAAKRGNNAINQKLWDFIKKKQEKSSTTEEPGTDRESEKDSADATSDIFLVTGETTEEPGTNSESKKDSADATSDIFSVTGDFDRTLGYDSRNFILIVLISRIQPLNKDISNSVSRGFDQRRREAGSSSEVTNFGWSSFSWSVPCQQRWGASHGHRGAHSRAPTQIQNSQPGEICEEYEGERQAFPKQIEIEKKNELKASFKFIANLFKEELEKKIEPSQKAEDKREKNLNKTMLVANPGHTPYSLNTAATKKNYSSAKLQFAKATEETSSSAGTTATSTLAAAAVASTSSLVKGFKTLSVRINRGTELLKQTVHKEILSKFPSKFAATTSGKGALAVPPTNTHRSPNRYSGRTDSLNLEMCHFKPIRTVPTTPNKRSNLPALETPKAKRIILKDRNINHNDGPKGNALSHLLLTSHCSAFYHVKSTKYALQSQSSQHQKISKASTVTSQPPAQRLFINEEVIFPKAAKVIPNRLNPVVRLKRCRIDTQRIDLAAIQVRPKRLQVRKANLKGPAVKRKLNGQLAENIQNVPKVRRSNRQRREDQLDRDGDPGILNVIDNPDDVEVFAKIIKAQKRCEKIIIQERLDFKLAKKIEKKISCDEPPTKRVTRSISKIAKVSKPSKSVKVLMPRRTTRESAKSARENFRGVN